MYREYQVAILTGPPILERASWGEQVLRDLYHVGWILAMSYAERESPCTFVYARWSVRFRRKGGWQETVDGLNLWWKFYMFWPIMRSSSGFASAATITWTDRSGRRGDEFLECIATARDMFRSWIEFSTLKMSRLGRKPRWRRNLGCIVST